MQSVCGSGRVHAGVRLLTPGAQAAKVLALAGLLPTGSAYGTCSRKMAVPQPPGEGCYDACRC